MGKVQSLLGISIILTLAFFFMVVTTVSWADDTPHLEALDLNPGQKVMIVATTTIVADVVKNIGGDRIDLVVLTPAGADPHGFEATPRDLTKVKDTHVVFANGFNFEEFLVELIEASGTKAALVSVSKGIQGLDFGGEGVREHGHQDERGDEEHGPEEEEEHESEEHAHGSENGGLDPHTWTDPNNVLVWVENIETALSELNPENRPYYRRLAKDYSHQLKVLDKEIRESISQIPPGKRKLITDHHVFGYFAHRYGLEVVGAVVRAESTHAEPSAKELARLQELVEHEGVKAIFVGSTVNPRISRQIARDTGIVLVPVYTGSLSQASEPAATYLDYMRFNVKTITGALK